MEKDKPKYGGQYSRSFCSRSVSERWKIPAYQNTFRRLYLNQWTAQETRWLDMEKWDACSGEPIIPEGAPCYLGLDLSSTVDITSASLFVQKLEQSSTGHGSLKREYDSEERRDRVPFSQWEREGGSRQRLGTRLTTASSEEDKRH